MSEELNYRSYITREFERRCKKNSQYSLRAFARDLDMAVSSLSEVLRMQTGLSEKSASKLIPKLNLTEEDSDYFKALVQFEHSRSKIKKIQAQKQLEDLKKKREFTLVDQEKAKIISDWYYTAILELTEIECFKPQETWIAKRLGLNLELTHAAVQRLFQLGLLTTKKDQWIKTHKQISFQSNVSNNDFKKHHLQMLDKAKLAITNLSPQEREISSVTLAISCKELTLIKKYLSDVRKKLMLTADQQQSKDRVFGLSLHFFPLDRSDLPAFEQIKPPGDDH